MTGHYRIGIDIGGTFTDAVLVDERTGDTRFVKVPSTPGQPNRAFFHAFDRLVQEHQLDPGELRPVVHATTVATNAILEGKLAKTAVLLTSGFPDILTVGRMIRPALYDLDALRPEPLVPRELCLEVDERLDKDGQVLRPLDESQVKAYAEQLEAAAVRAVVVCFLHSYKNDRHEQLALEILADTAPELIVVKSSEISLEFGEYVRASTATVNAALLPLVGDYFTQLTDGLASRGALGEALIMQSSGGVMPLAVASTLPIHIIESGPAAGVVGVSHLASALSLDKVLAFDMGGTTAKAALVVGGRPSRSPEFEVGTQALARVELHRGAGYPIKTPVIDLVEIGAGGGSIAWIDDGGLLRLGPHSAGADPGPACYGRGGTQATVTDANLVLGRLDPDYFLGGELPLDVDRARRAVAEHCALPLGIEIHEAAAAIIDLANASMLTALRIVSVQRGHDPAEVSLVCTGGAAGLHADALATALGAREALVPVSPGVASARGLLAADLRRDYRASCQVPLAPTSRPAFADAFENLERLARAAFGTGQDGSVDHREYALELRFVGQTHSLPVAVSDASMSDAVLDVLRAQFLREHRRLYGFAPESEPIETVTATLVVTRDILRPAMPAWPARESGEPVPANVRDVWLDAATNVSCPNYRWRSLCAGDIVPGPAVVSDQDTTVLISAASRGVVDHFGNLHIDSAR